MADQSALFACTKCHSRHPFEELSQSEQLCKECRNNYPVVKCTYCRAEFQQGKGSTNTICKKCAQNVKAYGKPTACEYCNVIAAFIGNRCQRCTNCEKKYGPPTTCEQCKQKCAFDRSEESCKKVDGKILCWLCTLAYRRVLAKTRNRQEEALKNYGSQRSSLGEMTGSGSRPIVLEESTNSSSSNQDNLDKNKLVDKSARNSESRDKLGSENKRDGSVEPSSADKGTSLGDKTDKHQSSGEKSHHHHRHHHHHHHHRHGSGDKHNHHSSKDKNKDHKSSSSSHKSKTHHSNNKSHHDHSSSKKAKIETTPTSSGTSTTTTTKTSTNGVTPTKSTSMASLSEKSIPDLSSTDHMIAITQLREELEALKKQIQGKDQQIKEREKKITELKAMQYESEKEVRTKINSLQKRHSEAIETLQIKNRDLMKQVASLSRGNKNKSSSIANSDSPAL